MSSVKLAFRNIQKNKSYSLINILGLTLAFTLCLLVFSVVIEENSYDKSWSKADRIYRINTIEKTAGGEETIPQAYANLGSEWKKTFPEIESESTIRKGKVYIKKSGNQHQAFEGNTLLADEDIMNVLDVDIIEGNPFPIIEGKRNLIISKSFKDKYFKDDEIIGKTLINADPIAPKPQEYVVTAVIQDLPNNSIFRSQTIVMNSKNKTALNKEGWGFYTEQFIVLKAGTRINEFSLKANTWYRNFLNDGVTPSFSFKLQPLKEIFMEPHGMTDISGDKKTNLIFQGVALLVLIISCINFINLYAVRTIKKVKTINLFKIMGANRASLIKTLLIETTMIFIFSGLISFAIYTLLLFPLENFLDYPLSYVRNHSYNFIIIASCFIIASSLIIGFYPAWIVSKINTSEALKNKISKSNRSEVWTKRVLIIIQFCISLIVIVGLVTIKSQMNYIHNIPRGIETDNLLNIKMFSFGKGYDVIQNELSRIPGIEKVSINAWTPNLGSGSLSKTIEEKENPDQQTRVSFITGDINMVPLLGIKLIAGRNLRESDYEGYPSDNIDEENIKNVLLTESTAKKLKISELGKLHKELGIIPVGIVADFHSESFHKKITPTVISPVKLESYGNVLIKVKPGEESQVIKDINTKLENTFPNRMINMEWVDEVVAKSYLKENKQAKLFTLFSALALFISALGVTGLILQSVEQRTKEIGIRKVLGASISNISNLFGKEYIVMILFSIILSSPIAWYLANKWLEDFAYKTEVQWWFFGVSGLIILLTTFITVNIQTIKAALENPVDSLREE